MFSFGKILLLGILAVVIIAFSANPQSAPIKPDLTLQQVLAALGGIFVIVLLVERATEILIAVWRAKPTQELERDLQALRSSDTKRDEAPAKAQELAAFKTETKGLALLAGFSLSVVVCAAGVGLLETIVSAPAGSKFLRGVDIVLTSSLIAGGSDAFHQFVRAIETFFTQMKARMEENTPPK